MYQEANRRFFCKNGVSLSIQAGQFTYASPRKDFAPHYEECEVCLDEEDAPAYFEDYADGYGIYAFVPVALVERFIAENGGIDLAAMLGGGGFIRNPQPQHLL